MYLIDTFFKIVYVLYHFNDLSNQKSRFIYVTCHLDASN